MTSRKRIALAAAAVALGAGLTACANDKPNADSGDSTATTTGGGGGGGGVGDAAAGKTTFAASCAACHGPDAKGLPNLGKDLTTSAFAKGLSDNDLVAFITKGRATDDPANTTGVAMPPKGGNPALTSKDLASVVAYVRTLEK